MPLPPIPTRRVTILIFDEVEVLDACGPYEVFSVAGRRDGLEPFAVATVADGRQPVRARNDLRLVPHHALEDCPPTDVLIIPGRYGTRPLLDQPRVIDWIRDTAGRAELVLSVCTGALLLARAGLLAGRQATTHHLGLDLLRSLAPSATVHPDRRYVDNGHLLLSAGVSAGIDASLYAVCRFLGEELAAEAARYMEYDWRRDPVGEAMAGP